MKRSRRLLALIVLTAVVLTAVFTGCGTKTTPENTTSTTTTVAESSAEPTTTAQDFGEPVTLRWLNMNSGYSGPWTGWFDDFVFEKTGVHIEVVQCTPERMQAALASGELLDIVTFQQWNNLETAIKGDMLLNLDEHLDALPNVTANLGTALQYMRDERSAGTGKVYGIPGYIGENNMISDTGVYAANVRWDIYQDIGAPAVKTVDDFLPVLKQMQEKYPKTPDGKKVYAFSLFPDWDGRWMYGTASLFVITGHFEGLADYFQIWNTRTGELTPLLDKEGIYIHALKFYNQAYRLGLLVPDSMTQTQANGYTKLQAGQMLTAWNCWDGNGAFNTKENIDADPPKGFKPIIFDDFYAATMSDYPVGGTDPLAISKNCENVDAALRFVDFLANYDNNMTICNGPEGFLWEIGSDGKPHVTDKYNDYLKDPTMEFPGGGNADKPGLWPLIRPSATNPTYGVPFAMAYWDEPVQMQNDNKLAKSWSDFYHADNPLALLKDQKRIVPRPLAYSLMEAAPDDIQMAANQIGDIVKPTSWKMVYAKTDAEFDKLYQDMVKKADGLGIKSVQDWAKTALEKAQTKAVKYEK